MSLRSLIRTERLRIQLALNEAKNGGSPRGSLLTGLGGMGSGPLRGLGSRAFAPRGAKPGTPIEQPGFQPNMPLLELLKGGNRPLRQAARNLILSQQQLQPEPQENPEPSLDPQIILCPMCGAQALDSFDYCPSCATILRQLGRQESRSLSVSA